MTLPLLPDVLVVMTPSPPSPSFPYHVALPDEAVSCFGMHEEAPFPAVTSPLTLCILALEIRRVLTRMEQNKIRR